MTPSAAPPCPPGSLGDGEAEALRLLAAHGTSPESIPGAAEGGQAARRAALATALMDLFRASGSREVFEALVRICHRHLGHRARMRVRHLAPHLDPQEVLQDAIVNIYRYPDRFDPCRPGAFAAWSSTIVDNAIRRQLRRRRGGPAVSLSPAEILCQHPDIAARAPDLMVQHSEDCSRALDGLRLLVLFYLAAFQRLSERERFVLQMVEVERMRYVQLAGLLGVRPEALKMVVFRARRRIHVRLSRWLGQGPAGTAAA
jgi:RNA polymerase sigma factor (sigma-70 family)